MMSAMIIDKAEKNGKLTEEEKRRLNEVIENKNDSDRVPKSEETVVENLKKEVRKLKIENNRSEVETKVLYGDRDRSRRGNWEKWSDYKRNSRSNSNQRSGSRSNYQRSDSHPGLWRSKSGTNYRKFESRTPTRQENRGSGNRSGSGNRNDQEKSLKERVNTIETTNVTILTEVKKLSEAVQALAKAKNVTYAPMFIRENRIELDEGEIAVSDAVSEVLFMRKEQSIETMTLDTGCPLSLVSEDWLTN